MSDPTQQRGLFVSLRRLLATVLEIALVRLEILGTEVELEKRRLFDGLLWGGAALLTLAVGVALVCGFVLMLFWETYRLAAVGVMALLFLSLGLLLVRVARTRLRKSEGMFETTLTEIKRDLGGLQTPSQDEHQ